MYQIMMGRADFLEAVEPQTLLFDLSTLDLATMLKSSFLIRFLVGQEQQEVQGNDRGARVEDVLPFQLPKLRCDQWTEPAANVHRLVENAPGHRTVFATRRLDNRALDAGFENTGTKGENDGASHEAPERREPGHEQVAEDLENRRREDGFLVADAVRDTAGENRYE